MSNSKKHFFPLVVVGILIIAILVISIKNSNTNGSSFTDTQLNEIETIVNNRSTWNKDFPISPARKPNKIAVTQRNGKTYFAVGYVLNTNGQLGSIAGSSSVIMRVYSFEPNFHECSENEYDKNSFAITLSSDSRSIGFSSSQSSQESIKQNIEDAYRCYLNNKS